MNVRYNPNRALPDGHQHADRHHAPARLVRGGIAMKGRLANPNPGVRPLTALSGNPGSMAAAIIAAWCWWS